MELDFQATEYIHAHQQEALELLTALAQIPAPPNQEQLRAEFCLQWLQKQGAKGVYMDQAYNVIYPVGCGEGKPIAVFAAHSDVVFPDMQPLPLKIADGWISCPGIGDDTGNVAALLMAAKYIAQNGLESRDWGLLLVVNSGEEGLGNLKGCKKLFETYGSRVKEFITFDLNYTHLYDGAVGSRRYEICVRTEGGHSLKDFGKPNAIAELSALIGELYRLEIPEQGRTTYNVGTVSGGTSVNTIAQDAQMLFEFRSDRRQSLEHMHRQLEQLLENRRREGVEITCRLVGDRPCSGDVDPVAQRALADRVAEAAKRHVGAEPARQAASTDCNIPLSLGIPAVCIGCLYGEGAHTREERVALDSLLPGLKICLQLVLHHI